MTTNSVTPLAGGNVVSHPAAASYDRRWLVVDGSHNWISDADLLSKINVSIRFGHLVLQADGMLRLDLPLDVIEDDDSVRCSVSVGSQRVDAVDEGEVAAVWLTACLGQTARLVKVHPDAPPVQWPANP